MFSRLVEVRCQAGKRNEVVRAINEKALPILKKQQGFRDEIAMTSHDDPDRIVGLSFWDRREDAERYQRETFSQIAELLRPLCEGEPRISTFEVSTSTAHKISQERAA